jgi:SAM-dependent MidA family methyltransferase
LNQLAEKIASEIAKAGAIPFARFMDLALYCPEYGYYEKEEDTIGRRGDFYTSVSVGGLFGELLAFQFAQWLEAPPPPQNQAAVSISRDDRPRIVEAGAHDGRLAGDILGWLRQHRPALFESLEYYIVEPSPRRQQRQRANLSAFEKHVRWVADLSALAPASQATVPNSPHESRITNHALAAPTRRAVAARRRKRSEGGSRSIIFANELLDAFPVHRLGWDAARRQWFEWGVCIQDDRFAWTRMPDDGSLPSLLGSFDLPAELLAALPDGFVLEVCPQAEAWWRQAARLLGRGKLLTLDYGTDVAQAPERTAGTLRAYYRHHLVEDVLDRPGEQDLTAHVNFRTLLEAGEAEGLITETFASQEQFLTRIAAQLWTADAAAQWPPNYKRQFQTLTHPQLLGQSFRVLVQSRAVIAAVPSATQ